VLVSYSQRVPEPVAKLRTRTYDATVVPGSDPHNPPHTFFDADVRGASFLADYDTFPVGVAGDLVAFELRGEGPYLVEKVAPNMYLALYGRAEASIGTGGASTITTAFKRVD
jgi:hypothetical protein